MPEPQTNQLDADGKLEKIARNVLGIQTAWQARGICDVHVELPIGKLKLALRAAYEAGRQSMK